MTEQAGEKRNEGSARDPYARAARDLLENLSRIEAVLQPLLGAGATAAFSLSPEERAFVGSNILRFMGFVTGTDWEKVEKRLSSADLTEAEITGIRAFAEKYWRRHPFFYRAYRAERGFENEVTYIWARPILHLRSKEFLLQLELYSHDKLLLVSHQEMDDVMTLVQGLLEAVRDSLKDAADIRKDLPAEAFPPEVVQQVVEAAEALYEFIPKPSPSSVNLPPASEPNSGTPTS